MNFVSSFGFTIVTFLTAFFSSRLVIPHIGDERFGAFRSLLELFGYLSLLEGGLALAIRPLFAQSLAKNRGDEVSELMHAAFISFRFGTLIALAVGLFLTFVVHRLVPVSPDLAPDLLIASFVMTFGLVNISFGPHRTLCEAMQRSFLTNLLLIGQTVCVTITSTTLCIHYPRWGITIQALSITLWVTSFNLILRKIAIGLRKSISATDIRSQKLKISFRNLAMNSRNSFVLMLAGRASIQSNSLILGMFVGQADVTKLYATQRLFDVIQSQLFGVGNASWAAMAEIYHQGRLDLFVKRIKQLIQLILVMGIATVVPVCLFNHDFVSLYVGSNRYGGDSLSIVMAINAIALSFTVFSTWCLTGTGMLKSVMSLAIVTSTLDVACTLLFTALWGRIGPVLGSCVVLCLISIPWHFRLLSEHFGLPFRQVIDSNARLVIFACVYAAVLYWMSNVLSIDTWLKLALVLGLPTLFFLASSMLFILDEDQMAILKRKIGIRR